MGNTQSNILERLDDIASEYILGADYNTLRKMKEKDYCHKVTIVTKDILEKQFSHLDIEYLATRANDGWSWDTMFRTTTADPETNTITYPAKGSVGFIRKIDNPNKQAMCYSISEFYVKIGHIFSAIVGTIKPRYNFSNGESYSILTPKKELPNNEEVFGLAENGFCYKRIEALKFGADTNPAALNPQFCNANSKYESANDLPGVPEFEMLYYDETDEEGNPMMSDRNLSTYRKDLTTFYKRFTDEETLPNDIHKFSDIQLKQYSNSERCMDNKYNQPIQPVGNSRESTLFEDYALNLREMIQVTGDLQQNLVEILNKIFTKKKEETDKITINPTLTIATVNKLIVDTRNKLLELYLRCEEYFENGVNIYKAIVNERIINNTFDEFITPVSNVEEEMENEEPQPPSQEPGLDDVQEEPETTPEEDYGEEEEHAFADDELPTSTLEEQQPTAIEPEQQPIEMEVMEEPEASEIALPPVEEELPLPPQPQQPQQPPQPVLQEPVIVPLQIQPQIQQPEIVPAPAPIPVPAPMPQQPAPVAKQPPQPQQPMQAPPPSAY